MYRNLLIVVLFCIGGCVSTYQEPTMDGVASLKIKNNTGLVLGSLGFKTAADCSGGKVRLGKGNGIPAYGTTAINLLPDEMFSFFVSHHDFSSGSNYRYVNLPVTFTPEKNGLYEFSFTVEDGRYLAIMYTLKNGEIALEKSFVHREWRVPFLETGSFCQ